MPSKKRQFDLLHGYRGLAVLIVFLSHAGGRDQYVMNFLNIDNSGRIGVYLFFVLSAFLLAYKYKNSFSSALNFYVRRFLRIFPLYFVVLTVLSIWELTTGVQIDRGFHLKDAHPVVYEKHLLFLRGDGVFWTLPEEMWFYAILPLVCFFFSSPKKVLGVLSLCVALWFGHGMVDYLGMFLVAAAIGFLAKQEKIKEIPASYHKIICAIFLIGLVTALACTSRNLLGFSSLFMPLKNWYFLFAVVFSLPLVSMVYEKSAYTGFMSWQPLVWVGKRAFSIYLLHLPVISGVNYALDNSPAPLKLLVSIAIIGLITHQTYRWIEKPFISISYTISDRMKKRFKAIA